MQVDNLINLLWVEKNHCAEASWRKYYWNEQAIILLIKITNYVRIIKSYYCKWNATRSNGILILQFWKCNCGMWCTNSFAVTNTTKFLLKSIVTWSRSSALKVVLGLRMKLKSLQKSLWVLVFFLKKKIWINFNFSWRVGWITNASIWS